MSLRIIPTEPAKLFKHYDGQSVQDAYIELDLREQTLLADYNAVVGNAIPGEVRNGFERRYQIPLLTGEAADALMKQIRPLAEEIVEDWREEWNGHNHVVILGEDAEIAENQIEEIVFAVREDYDPASYVTVWTPDNGACPGNEAKTFDITADTTDERLAEIEEEIRQGLIEVSDSPVVVLDGVDDYLARLRQDARDRIGAMSAAELRAARDELGLTGGWLAAHMGVTERTERRWETGEAPVPYEVAERMRELLQEAAEAVEQKVADATGARDAYLLAWRSDEQLPEELRATGYPARWHMRIAERALVELEATGRPWRLFYADEPRPPEGR